jgi:hypothetical protein
MSEEDEDQKIVFPYTVKAPPPIEERSLTDIAGQLGRSLSELEEEMKKLNATFKSSDVSGAVARNVEGEGSLIWQRRPLRLKE